MKVLYFHTFVYISHKSHMAILYNTTTNKYLNIYCKDTISLIAKMLKEKVYYICIHQGIAESEYFSKFLNDVENGMFGEVVNVKSLKSMPAYISPHITVAPCYATNLNQFKSKHKKEEQYSHEIGKDVLTNLLNITLHFSNSTDNFKEFTHLWKQFIFPQVSNIRKKVNLEHFKNNINTTITSFLNSFNLVIGDVDADDYDDIENLLQLFDCTRVRICIYICINGFVMLPPNIKKKREYSYIIYLSEDLSEEKMNSIINNYNNVTFCKPITSFIEEDNFDNITYIPFYNKLNKKFCIDYLSYSFKELKDVPISEKNILSNSIINQSIFGSLVILSDGKVYSSINRPSIGTLKTHTFSSLLFKELSEKGNWFLSRRKFLPCKKCVFNNLCPPVSNFELYMQKYDFCKRFPSRRFQR